MSAPESHLEPTTATVEPNLQPFTLGGVKVSKRNTALINYILGLGQTFLIVVNGILLIPLYFQHIGVPLYGAWLASGSVLGIISTTEAGLSSILTQRLTGALAKNDLQNYAKIAAAGITLVTFIATVVTLIGLLLTPLMPIWFKISGNDAASLTQAMVLAGIATGLALVAQTLGALPQACQRPLGMGVVMIIGLFVGNIVIVVSLLSGQGVIALGLGVLVIAAIRVIGNSLLIVYHWRIFELPTPSLSRSMMRSLGIQLGPLFVARIGRAFGENSESSISASLISPTAAAILVITSRLTIVIRMVVGLVGSAVFASVSFVHGEGVSAKTGQVFLQLIRINSALLAIGLGLALAFNGPLIILWVGIENFGGDLLSLVVILTTAIVMRNMLLESLLDAMGHFQVSAFTGVVEVIIRFTLMILLAHVLGIVGVALAGLISGIAVKAWLLPRLIARSLKNDKFPSSVMRFAGVPILIVCLIEGAIWHSVILAPSTWAQLILQGAALMGILVCTAMLDKIVRDTVLNIARSFANSALKRKVAQKSF